MPALPTGLRPIQLYHDVARLGEDLQRCREFGLVEVSFDCSDWADGERLHDDVAAGLDLPAYYGRNLDALDELMGETAVGNIGATVDAAGLVVVLHRFDRFHLGDSNTANAVLDIVHRAAMEALIAGRALVCLVQSDDLSLRPGPVGLTAVPWNSSERRHRA